MRSAAGPQVVVDAELDDGRCQPGFDVGRWGELASETLTHEGVGHGRLDLMFVTEHVISGLNQDHMGKQGPTDVLAFPLDGPEVFDGNVGPGLETDLPVHLGDVVVCPSVAERQAPVHAGTFDAEMSLLVIHGVLHVLGYDHVEQAETEMMRKQERWHLARYGLIRPDPMLLDDPGQSR